MSFDPIEFVVHGTPQPAGSKKAFLPKNGKRPIIVDDAKKSRPWKNQVAEIARQHYSGEVLREPVKLCLEFVLPRPKWHFGSGKNATRLKESAPVYPTIKPDASKMLRAVEDALTGVVWGAAKETNSQTVTR